MLSSPLPKIVSPLEALEAGIVPNTSQARELIGREVGYKLPDKYYCQGANLIVSQRPGCISVAKKQQNVTDEMNLFGMWSKISQRVIRLRNLEEPLGSYG